ncbi:flagellar biosynthetic protein FliQ [Kineobactrum sediminis]|uniref:Flagellar biosynthetic protein FliQ n=1 Tax=Kineobactrum sediminis TaxID=1905677 RepID=A0A2N5Y6E0_9GAMM|nr:flagellar biosynthesis protein FliQ [Kineobactrum sediminis]PLW83965.1 flagellar biosynthetic protein FliQ [Kineobactrum sediminis]
MSPDLVVEVGRQSLWVIALLVAPLLLSALATGLLIGMFQAATSINEMTLSFIPKLIVLAIALMLSGAWMLELIVSFSRELIMSIPELIGLQ